MKRSLYCAVLVLLVLGCYSGADTKNAGDAPESASTELASPDLAGIADGTYTGSHRSGLVSATVEITVADHAITAFVIKKHRSGKGRPAEAIAGRVLERQTLAVDVVSGATVSSRVILEAAGKALADTTGSER